METKDTTIAVAAEGYAEFIHFVPRNFERTLVAS
jgi:hypothetical protein